MTDNARGHLDLDPHLNLGEARRRFFLSEGLPADGGYSERFFRLRLGFVAIPLPNIPARVRAARLHDLHHVLTGYLTTWRGEAAIGAWELASGCGRYWAAWVLNLYAFAIGLAIAPRRLCAAFVRGRRSGNLYELRSEEAVIQRTVNEVRTDLGLTDNAPRPTISDILIFTALGCLSLTLTFLPAIILMAALVW
jgi:hypothetical protein